MKQYVLLVDEDNYDLSLSNEQLDDLKSDDLGECLFTFAMNREVYL